ncbi:hypothetical protein ACW9IB_24050 [Pseudomonas sp. SDO524_S393]
MPQTTGSLSAQIINQQVIPPDHPFVGDADEMLMYLRGGALHISATQRLGSNVNQFNGVDLRIPNIIQDGVVRTYTLPDDAEGVYWAHEQGGVTPYSAVKGSIKVSLDSRGHLAGEFSFSATNGSRSVQVSQGAIDLVGLMTRRESVPVADPVATGWMRGTVPGGPMPTPAFEATQVSLRKVVEVNEYHEVVGRQFDDFPPVQNLILIVVNTTASGPTFDLATTQDVRVAFGRVDTFGFAYAISGTLSFTSMPDTGHAVGTVDCQVQRNQEPPFSVRVSFDIR